MTCLLEVMHVCEPKEPVSNTLCEQNCIITAIHRNKTRRPPSPHWKQIGTPAMVALPVVTRTALNVEYCVMWFSKAPVRSMSPPLLKQHVRFMVYFFDSADDKCFALRLQRCVSLLSWNPSLLASESLLRLAVTYYWLHPQLTVMPGRRLIHRKSDENSWPWWQGTQFTWGRGDEGPTTHEAVVTKDPLHMTILTEMLSVFLSSSRSATNRRESSVKYFPASNSSSRPHLTRKFCSRNGIMKSRNYHLNFLLRESRVRIS
jgi:hypothetical protein